MSRQIIIIITLSSALIFGIGLVSPKYQDLNRIQKQIGEKKAELQSQEEYFSNLKKTSEELKSYEVQLSKIDSALPPDPFVSFSVLFDFIQKASSQSGLILKVINPVGSKPSQTLEGIQETALSLIVSGSYSSFKNFLSLLEKTSRLIEVENISFSSLGEEAPLNFNLRIKVYSY